MKTNEAKEIVTFLANGMDPHTGEIFPEDSTYQNPETVRALFMAVKGIERLEAYESRMRQLPKNAGKPWGEEEDKNLGNQFEEGASIKDLALTHERTESSIQSRLIKLGKISFE